VYVLEPLTTLIDAAREAGVAFVYAISPGLDITYSSSKDIICLKHKLEQVASFGCEAFAVLFDDIDIELCDADRSLYQSFASAQVCDWCHLLNRCIHMIQTSGMPIILLSLIECTAIPS